MNAITALPTPLINAPKLSVIVPLYNNEKEIGPCLESIFASDWKDFEVIVIDDCSTDRSLAIAREYPCRFFSTARNSGPAAARNIGISNAAADIILFLDSDTRVRENSLRLFHETFVNHPGMSGVIALPETTSLRKGRAPNYNALRNHYTLYSASEVTNYFTTQMGALRKEVLVELGGFDERFRGADIEDIELGMRIAPGRIMINKDVLIGHHFPSFASILRKYFKRAMLLTEVARERSALSGAHATARGLFSVMIASLNFLSLALALFYPWMLFVVLFTFALFIWLNYGLFSFSAARRGRGYVPEAVYFEYAFSLAIFSGGISGALLSQVRRTMDAAGRYLDVLRLFTSRVPTYLIFQVTSACNSLCETCFNWRDESAGAGMKELTTDEIELASRSMGYLQYVTLGGGEPFLRNDLEDICAIFYRNNKTRYFSIPTNGLLPSVIAERTKNILFKCPNAVLRVSLSIDGIGELHDAIRGTQGNFSKAEETYALLNGLRKRHANLEVLANTTFCSRNQDHIRKIHEYIRTHFNFDMHGLTLVRGNPRNPETKNVDLGKYEDALKIFEATGARNQRGRVHLLRRLLGVLPIFARHEVLRTARSSRRTYACHAIKRMLVIDAVGNVRACEMLPDIVGNVRDHDYDVAGILSSPLSKELLASIERRECNCTWECAIQDSLVFDVRKYPAMIKKALFG